MKQFLAVVGVITVVVAVAIVVLKRLPAPCIREDFVVE